MAGRPAALILLAALVPSAAWPATGAARHVAIVDSASVLGVNAISTIVTNVGSFGYDRAHGLAGFEFPKGSGRTAIFAGGLWIGAIAASDTVVALSEYVSEFGPGAMSGTLPDDPARPEYHVYDLKRRYPSLAARDQALAAYLSGARPRGAPDVAILADGTLDIPGDEMTWAVYNDADASRHTAHSGGTAPLGIEVQQTVFAFHRPGPLDSTVFLRYRIIAKGATTLDQAWLSPWLDFDLGNFVNDLEGCDTTRDLGFAYNADELDNVYANMPVALGLRLLRGVVDGGDTLGMTAFSKYIGGDDPDGGSESYRLLTGLRRDGSPFIDPSSGLPSPFFAPGDPVSGTGWRDTIPTDRRFMVNTGPFTMAWGDTQDVLFAITLATGQNRLDAITKMKLASDEVKRIAGTFGATTFPDPDSIVSVFTAAAPGRISLTWHVGGNPGVLPSIERFDDDAGPAWLADLAPDAAGYVSYVDATVSAGHSYRYQLSYAGASSIVTGGVVDVLGVRGATRLAGLSPNPSTSGLAITLTLGGREPAVFEMFDLSGRRVMRRELSGLAPGAQRVVIDPAVSLPPGVYLMRLTQNGRASTARGVVLK